MFIHAYNDIIKIENILATWDRFLRGKRHKKDVVIFQSRLAENLADLHRSLIDRSYKHGGYKAFNISDPKPRDIHKATVRDRVLHHLIYKELHRYFDIRFINDSYSCRKNKGTHRALNRFREFAGKVSKNNTRTCYVLKCDIRKFFATIDHEILMTVLKRRIEDPGWIQLLEKVIASFYSTRMGVGLPLGNITSQLLVNVYMHEFDMYVKQELRVKYYLRYADDFVVMSDCREYLEEVLVKMDEFLKGKLKLALHEDKVYIATYASGVDFLGWVHFPHHRILRTATKRKVVRRLRGYPKVETVNSYRGLLDHGNTYKIAKSAGLLT